MIKTITQRSLHEVLQEMRAKGVTLKDTEGFGINMDQSGHVYVVYMGEEEETGYIDVSAGEAGVSAWFNPNPSNAHSNPIEITAVETLVEYSDSVSLTHSSGNTWTITLNAANDSYVKPRTFFVQATDNGPELADNGLGQVVINNHERTTVGTINYETGAVSITYPGYKKAPNSASSVYVKYAYSTLPNTAVFPKLVGLSHIVFICNDSTSSIQYTLFNNNPANTQNSLDNAPVFFNTLTPSTIAGGDAATKYVEDFCDSRVSLCLNTDVDNRKSRWMHVTLTGTNARLKAVYVYWNRLST